MVLSIVIIYCSILVLCILFFLVGYVMVLKINKRDCHFKLGCKRIICAINNSSYIGFQTGDVAQRLESEFISKDPGFDPLAWQGDGNFAYAPVHRVTCVTVFHYPAMQAAAVRLQRIVSPFSESVCYVRSFHDDNKT